MPISLLFAALTFSTASSSFVAPDGIVAPKGVDVRVTPQGVVEVRAPNGVDEVTLLWKRPLKPDVRVLRDDWERSYGAAGWTTVSENVGSAWYTMIERDGVCDGWGVATQPNAFAWWTTSEKGIALTLDLRAGGRPVKPGNRTIEAVRLVMREGRRGESAFAAGRAFCAMMCPHPRLPKAPVYGYNDWYCAYGQNTATNFLADAAFVMSLADGLENRPYVVMDDGWQKNSPPVVKPLGFGSSGWGPWDESGERFGMKMKPFAEAVAKLGAKPGLWYRPFRAWQEAPEEMKLKANPLFFDPSHPKLRQMVYDDIRRFRSWGMKLVKIDYLTMDVAEGTSYPRRCGARPVKADYVWRDESRTTVEVMKDLYRTMREAAGEEMVIIGCNALNHLAAGLFEVQRTGGDTSGWKWSTTRLMGVNTLGARAIQDRTFFAVDADCVGLAQEGAVPWEKNSQWLELVSRSGTPLFVSWKKELATAEVRAALKKAFAVASAARATAEPLDWQTTALPCSWRFADGERKFNWGAPEPERPAFRVELENDDVFPSPPETFALDDQYGLKGVLASVHTNLDLMLDEKATRRLVLRRGKVDGYESYRVEVGAEAVTLTAEDDEGMRRAAYYFEDRVRAGDLADVTRKPWLRNRISRCFFGPIKRPPFNRDELMDDEDYYPPAYLNRLAREGINGLWLTVEFADLAATPYRPVSPTRERRIAKLRKTVERCSDYGIKTWLFFIEPRAAGADDAFFAAHPETCRPLEQTKERCVMCTAQQVARDYLEASAKSIFEAVPGLAGAIAITHGERVTTCLWNAEPATNAPTCTCADCAKLAPWQRHNNLVGPLVRGMRAANPNAELISWFYHPQPTSVRGAWVAECAKHLPEGVTLQYNFESGAEKEQLGKVCVGGDYWLSFVGPAKPFEGVAAAARAAGAPLSAKIQVGCSHETATVPYVPAPGLLYRKYREMKRAGVTSVMQCWYFGNYPGTMNAAAGELAFEEFKDGEEAFLERLARPDWGANAKGAARAWEATTRGYMEYPLANQMQYYGPVHAGLTWPLLPDVAMRGLPRSWKPQDTPSGDLVGECLDRHDIGEAIALFDAGLAQMRGGGAGDPLDELEKRLGRRDWQRHREVALMRTLRIQFESSRNILEFYLRRAEAVTSSRGGGEPQASLARVKRMREIVLRERELGRQMARLAFADSRLGYHSESEDYRFDPAKLQHRADGLAWCDARLAEIEEELRAGKPWPLSEHERTAPEWKGCRYDDAGNLLIEGSVPNAKLTNNVEVYLYDVCGVSFVKKYAAKNEGGRFSLKVPAADWDADPVRRPGWIMIHQFADYWMFDGDHWPADPDFHARLMKDSRLNLWGIDSDRFGRLVP